ncbi:hypothetical protein [Amycolatopsis sp. NPDC059021]|uniref:hypothetical protein n=1 Tax=Amycolatopsis sp. NPDC059021 TaxID=3346704 RepID=UPI003672E2BF
MTFDPTPGSTGRVMNWWAGYTVAVIGLPVLLALGWLAGDALRDRRNARHRSIRRSVTRIRTRRARATTPAEIPWPTTDQDTVHQ